MQTEYRASPIAAQEGNKRFIQADSLGNTKVTAATLEAGEDITNDVTKVELRFTPTYISTATTTVIKTGTGLLHTLTVQGGTAGTIIVYDNTAASGTVLASFDSTNALETYTFDCTFNTGLTVVTSAATKLTVNSR